MRVRGAIGGRLVRGGEETVHSGIMCSLPHSMGPLPELRRPKRRPPLSSYRRRIFLLIAFGKPPEWRGLKGG